MVVIGFYRISWVLCFLMGGFMIGAAMDGLGFGDPLLCLSGLCRRSVPIQTILTSSPAPSSCGVSAV